MIALSIPSDWSLPVFYLAAGLLVLAGASKVARPHAARRALSAAGLRSSNATVRTLGVVEVSIGFWSLLDPGPAVAVGVSGLYISFAVFLSYLIWFKPGPKSCGCLGKDDLPPSMIHVGLDLIASLSSLAVAFQYQRGIGSFVIDLGSYGMLFLGATLLLGYSLYATVAFLPDVFKSYQGLFQPVRHDSALTRQLRDDEALRAAGIGPGHPSLYRVAPGKSFLEGSDTHRWFGREGSNHETR